MKDCPSRDELTRFAEGGLDDAAIERVGTHLDFCPACRIVIDRNSPMFRESAQTSPFQNEAGLRRAEERVATLDPTTCVAEETSVPLGIGLPGGTWLSSYMILRVIGRGGMGIVYEAEDAQLKRRVALKVMKPHLALDENSRRRFLREARAAAGLRDDRIVTIHHVGEDRGTPYLVMEYLEGESLGTRLRRENRLPISEVKRIGIAVAEGLAAAHAHGLIHRDVKPDNIWLTKTGDVKLLDFGLARQARGDAEITSDGAVMGTPAYMAPEQARSEASVDHRSDLFGLGCVLYRASTGSLPFPGADAFSTLMQLASSEPAPANRVNLAVPRDLSDLIQRLLAKDPAARPKSAAEVAGLLRGGSHSRRRLRNAAIACVFASLFAAGIWAANRSSETPVPQAADSNLALLLSRESSITIPGLSLQNLEQATIEFTCRPEAAEYMVSTHLIGVPRQCSMAIDRGGRLWIFGFRAKAGYYSIAIPAPQSQIRVAATRARRDVRLFGDGKLMSATSNGPTEPIEGAENAFVIGGFVGEIDEIRISRVARYEWDYVPADRLATDANTLALYHCDEDAGEVLVDASGNGRNGKIVNAKWVSTNGK